MRSSVTANNRVLIRRFQAQYLVSREHPAPERLKSRLDETVALHLAQTLTPALAPWFSNSDSSLWFIRSLNVELDVNVAWAQEQVTQALASTIARSLATSVQGGSDGEEVVWFPDRAAYLARFLADIADGHAWNKWYYESFEGLRPLPISAALRTAICERPVTGREGLRQLVADDLTKVLRALTAQDARRILDSLSVDATAGEEFGCFQAAWDAMQRDLLDTGDEWRNALQLYLAAGRDRTDVGGLPLRAAVLALLHLSRCLIGGASSEGEKLLSAFVHGDSTILYAAVGAANAEALLPLLRCPPAWVQEVGQTLLGRNAGPVADEASTLGPRHTPFGGIFLLLPFLDELPLEEATCGWPDSDEVAAVALVRFLLLMKCCGRPRAQRVFTDPLVRDPLVRDLMGIAPSVTSSILADWQIRISHANLHTFLNVLTSSHREYGTVAGRTMVLASVPASGSPVAVLIDGARGVWRFARGYHPRRPEQILEPLQVWLAQCGREGPVLVSDPVFIEPLRSAFPGQKVVGLLDDATQMMAAEDQQLAEVLARLDTLHGDLSYLSLPKSLSLARSFDLALSVAAQGLMRAFAWRLPGFAGSNLPYLYSNFLDFPGSVEEEPARWVVRLGRPPLHLILNMTDMARKTYQLNWLDERPFALFPEG